MTSKSTKPDWSISAPDFGRSLKGFGVNLLVRDIEISLKFATDILHAKTVYWNEDFAVLSHDNMQWMLHTDHTYSHNPYLGIAEGQQTRGTGVELRLYNLNPDDAENRARNAGYIVLTSCADKPHGLRECYIIDPDGYCWVPSVPLPKES